MADRAYQTKKTYPDFNYEKKLWQQGYNFVVGLDEAGRGPLAGPVVAAAVAINSKFKIQEINDSKKLSASQRERWYGILTNQPNIKYGVGIVSEKIIDRINILEATKMAMKKALDDLGVRSEYLLLDGNFILDGMNINQKAVKRGDEKIWSCAAASIIAKVTRDRLMAHYDRKYPVYGFNKHKGYGTRAHFFALKQHGPCAIHRRTFAPVRFLLNS